MLRDLPIRKKNRLLGYDYSQNGTYFITICTKDRSEMFWKNQSIYDAVGHETVNSSSPNLYCASAMVFENYLSEYGIAVNNAINDIELHYKNISVDNYVIMPNHIHMIISLHCEFADGFVQPNSASVGYPTISTVIQQFKGAVTKKIVFGLWQKSFHDHIIRNEEEYCKIWQYIDNNPVLWEQDCFNPNNIKR